MQVMGVLEGPKVDNWQSQESGSELESAPACIYRAHPSRSRPHHTHTFVVSHLSHLSRRHRSPSKFTEGSKRHTHLRGTGRCAGGTYVQRTYLLHTNVGSAGARRNLDLGLPTASSYGVLVGSNGSWQESASWGPAAGTCTSWPFAGRDRYMDGRAAPPVRSTGADYLVLRIWRFGWEI